MRDCCFEKIFLTQRRKDAEIFVEDVSSIHPKEEKL